MPSVLDQKFKINFEMEKKHKEAVQRYLEQNVGNRTYYLHSRIGGKRWAMDFNHNKNTITIGLDDESLASFITLKFS